MMGQEYLEQSGNKLEDLLHGAAKARPFESAVELREDQSNIGEDRVDIISRVVGWGSTGYAKIMSMRR